VKVDRPSEEKGNEKEQAKEEKEVEEKKKGDRLEVNFSESDTSLRPRSESRLSQLQLAKYDQKIIEEIIETEEKKPRPRSNSAISNRSVRFSFNFLN